MESVDQQVLVHPPLRLCHGGQHALVAAVAVPCKARVISFMAFRSFWWSAAEDQAVSCLPESQEGGH